MEKTFRDELKEVMKSKGVNVPELAAQTGIPKGRIYGWDNDDTQPKAADQLKLRKWMSGETLTNLNKTEASQFKESSITDQTILELAKSQTKLADANKTLAETNSRLERRLPAIEGSPIDTVPIEGRAIELFLEKAAHLGVPRLWKTVEQGVDELSKIFLEIESKTSAKGKRGDGNKLSKAKT